MFEFLPAAIRTPLAFVIVLGVLVFIHELGHYLAARWRGVYVEAFSIGFGRAIAQWTDRSGTVWKLAWLPLGGYVKMHGQERPQDVPDDVRAQWKEDQTFHGKSVGSRAIIVAAGPIANFLLAAVLFSGLFMAVGRPVAVPVVGEVVADSAASRAGLQAGDRIDAIDATPIAHFEDLQRIVSSHPGQGLTLHVRRGDTTTDIVATPDSRDSSPGHAVGVLGIRAGASEFERLSPIQAIPAGITQTYDVTVQTFAGVWGMLTSRRGAEDLGGPLRIAQMSGQVAQLGIGSLISFIAVLSVNLGLINLFPIPVLDGGHLLFYLAEAIRGKPLPPRAQDYGIRAGVALLIGLFVCATWNDLIHIGLFRWVSGLIG